MNNTADEVNELSDGEAALIEFYRALDDESQTLFFRLAEAMADDSVTVKELEEMKEELFRDANFRDGALATLEELGTEARLMQPV